MTQVQEATLPIILECLWTCHYFRMVWYQFIRSPGNNMSIPFCLQEKMSLQKQRQELEKQLAFWYLLPFSPTSQFDCHSSLLNYCSDTTPGLTHLTEFTLASSHRSSHCITSFNIYKFAGDVPYQGACKPSGCRGQEASQVSSLIGCSGCNRWHTVTSRATEHAS